MFESIALLCTVCRLFPAWDPPTMWSGPEPAVYMSFDCLDGLDAKEGSVPGTVDLSTIDGKVLHFQIFFAGDEIYVCFSESQKFQY